MKMQVFSGGCAILFFYWQFDSCFCSLSLTWNTPLALYFVSCKLICHCTRGVLPPGGQQITLMTLFLVCILDLKTPHFSGPFKTPGLSMLDSWSSWWFAWLRCKYDHRYSTLVVYCVVGWEGTMLRIQSRELIRAFQSMARKTTRQNDLFMFLSFLSCSSVSLVSYQDIPL